MYRKILFLQKEVPNKINLQDHYLNIRHQKAHGANNSGLCMPGKECT
jgi:hypothetical protein